MLCRYFWDSCPQAKWSNAMNGDANLLPWNRVKRDSSTLTRTLYSKQAFALTHTTHTQTRLHTCIVLLFQCQPCEKLEKQCLFLKDVIFACNSDSFVHIAGKSSLANLGLSLLVTILSDPNCKMRVGGLWEGVWGTRYQANKCLAFFLLHCFILKLKAASETMLYLWPLRWGSRPRWGSPLNSGSDAWKSQLLIHATALLDAHEPLCADSPGDLKHTNGSSTIRKNKTKEKKKKTHTTFLHFWNKNLIGVWFVKTCYHDACVVGSFQAVLAGR